jgi:hypothetical protein
VVLDPRQLGSGQPKPAYRLQEEKGGDTLICQDDFAVQKPNNSDDATFAAATTSPLSRSSTWCIVASPGGSAQLKVVTPGEPQSLLCWGMSSGDQVSIEDAPSPSPHTTLSPIHVPPLRVDDSDTPSGIPSSPLDMSPIARSPSPQ